jgi:hypothetical protein
MKVSNCDVRDAYRRAIAKVWDLKQKAIKGDIHLGNKAPGGWSEGKAILEIYCEQDIPNASDILHTPYGTIWHSESWVEIDKTANDILGKKFPSNRRRFHFEPYNNAVVCIWES